MILLSWMPSVTAILSLRTRQQHKRMTTAADQGTHAVLFCVDEGIGIQDGHVQSRQRLISFQFV